jgi:hypothetical protein
VALGKAITALGLVPGPDQTKMGDAVDAGENNGTAGIFIVHRITLLKRKM